MALFDSVPSVFRDSRTGRNIQHHLTALLRQVYSRLHEDVNDAHRLSVDPTMRRITGKKLDDKNAASANTMGRFETQMLSVEDNLQALSEVNGRWVERALQKTTHRASFWMWTVQQVVHGQQEASDLQRAFRMHLLPSPVLPTSSEIAKVSCFGPATTVRTVGRR